MTADYADNTDRENSGICKELVDMLTIESRREWVSEISWDDLQSQLTGLPGGTYFAVVDSGAKWFFDERIKGDLDCKVFDFEPSEEKKSQKTADWIRDSLLESNADRDAVLVAVGGGITCDVTGYAASIFKRGIPWIAVPTTLLAQVDASVGGKTAVNSPSGKNVVGSFHPPVRVIMTHEPSRTWTSEIKQEGLAEIIKIFLMFDLPRVAEFTASGMSALNDEMTKRSVELKAEVVKIDPWEKNLRAALNYGHTFGHAIEHCSRMRHGIAVSYGIRIANRVSELMQIMSGEKADQVDDLLNKLGFPDMKDMPDFESFLSYMREDKKIRQGNIRMVLIDGENPIEMKAIDPTHPVPLPTLKEAYLKTLKCNC